MFFIKNEKDLKERFGVIDIEKALDEADEEANNPNTKYYSHEEFKKMARKIIDEKNKF